MVVDKMLCLQDAKQGKDVYFYHFHFTSYRKTYKCNKSRKGNKKQQIGKEIKLPLLADDVII